MIKRGQTYYDAAVPRSACYMPNAHFTLANDGPCISLSTQPLTNAKLSAHICTSLRGFIRVGSVLQSFRSFSKSSLRRSVRLLFPVIVAQLTVSHDAHET